MSVTGSEFIAAGALFLLGAGAGVLVGWLVAQRRISALREENVRLGAEKDAERRLADEKAALLEETRGQMSQTFSTLSGAALKDNAEAFLRLARENLGQFQVKANSELEKKEKAIENLVLPIRETLKKTEEQIARMEEERQRAYGSLTKHLDMMAKTQAELEGQTRNLVRALKRPEVRGRWGEMTLRRLAELAGMVNHCDFYEQEQVATPEGRLRPDMIVRMPEGREIVVDVKTPLDAYLDAMEAPDEDQRTRHLERHARNLRERVRELSGKAYWAQFSAAPEFAVLFIPGDQFLSAALDRDRTLLEDAMARKVILATPTSFMAILRAVGYGWRQLALAKNAEQIRDLGEDVYRRLTVFTDHLAKLGRSLASSVDNYNRAVGSLERQVLPGARRFTEMGIGAKKEIETVDQIEKQVRDLGGSASADSPD